MGNITDLNIHKYKLIIFDWDGTLVDSLPMYMTWDQLYVERFYDTHLPIEYFEELANKIKKKNPGHSEDEYFLYLDNEFGSGNTSIEVIWKNIYSLAPEIQSRICYKAHAPQALKKLRTTTNAKITLATNAELKDILFYSSQRSETAKHLSPIDYFDGIITLDDVLKPKPHPESFQKMIDRFSVDINEVLVFEDSFHGVSAAKAAGVDTILLDDSDAGNLEASAIADYSINSWQEIIAILNK